MTSPDGRRVDAQVGVADRLLDHRDHLLLPRLHGDGARIGERHAGDLGSGIDEPGSNRRGCGRAGRWRAAGADLLRSRGAAPRPDLPIFCSADFLTSLIMRILGKISNGRGVPSSPPITTRDSAPGTKIENTFEQYVLVAAQRERRGVHHLQVLDDRLVERERPRRTRAPSSFIGSAVYTPSTLVAFSTRVHAHLAPAQRGGGVGREERLPVPAAKITTLPSSRWRSARPADVRLGDLVDPPPTARATRRRSFLERVPQRQRVHEGGQHAHVVGGRAVHAASPGATPRKMLPPPMTMAICTLARSTSAISATIRSMVSRSMP